MLTCPMQVMAINSTALLVTIAEPTRTLQRGLITSTLARGAWPETRAVTVAGALYCSVVRLRVEYQQEYL